MREKSCVLLRNYLDLEMNWNASNAAAAAIHASEVDCWVVLLVE